MDTLTIQQAVGLNIGILTKILQVIIHVNRFRQDCNELGSMVASLLAMVGASSPSEDSGPTVVALQEHLELHLVEEHSHVHPDLPDLQAARRLHDVLKEIQVFVEKCTGEWNFWQRGWEIAVTQNLPRLKRELFEWVILCIMENSASAKNQSRFDKDQLQKNLKEMKGILKKLPTKDDISQRMEDIHRIAQLQMRQSQLDVNPVEIEFPDGDPRLYDIQTLSDSMDLVAQLEEPRVGRVQVIYKEIKNFAIKSSRHVEIYRLISSGTHVQEFYGIAEVGAKRYAVLEYLQNDPTLAEGISSASELSCDLLRLNVAYEIASTVAYLHSVGIVVKNISDVNIVLKRREDQRGLRPCLINLDAARRLVETTSHVEHDVRFEAFEYAIANRSQSRRHSHQTDIWSLGVVIWECVVRSFPFATRPADMSLEGMSDTIRTKLAAKELPWKNEDDRHSWSDVYNIVQSCWNFCAVLRPPASYVAQTLLDYYTRRSVNAQLPTHEVKKEVEDTVYDRILASRQRRHDGPRVDPVPLAYARMLKTSIDTQNNPHHSFLLGAAIWWELVDVEEFSDSLSDGRRLECNGVGAFNPDDVKSLKRPRVALHFLENSGKEARKETGLAHAFLGLHFLSSCKAT